MLALGQGGTAGSRSTGRARCARGRSARCGCAPASTAALLRAVQVLKLSEEEARAAYGTLDPAAIAERCGVPEVVVTLGHDGARVSAGGETGELPAHRVRDVDPTGAGDAFLALYASARGDGAPPLAATEQACRGVGAWLAARREAARAGHLVSCLRRLSTGR